MIIKGRFQMTKLFLAAFLLIAGAAFAGESTFCGYLKMHPTDSIDTPGSIRGKVECSPGVHEPGPHQETAAIFHPAEPMHAVQPVLQIVTVRDAKRPTATAVGVAGPKYSRYSTAW